MKKVVEFLKGIKDTDNVIIIFHNDTDGAVSATLLMKLLKTVENVPDLISQPMPINENLVQKIKTYMPNKIIFVDLAVDQQYDIVKELGSFCNILIIDHHVPLKNLNGRHIVHYNPVFDKKDIYQSASYLTYNLCNKIIDMKKWLWLAGLGVIGDYNLDDSKDLVKDVEEEYSGIKKTGIENSILADINNMILATKATKDLTLEQIVYVLNEMGLPEDVRTVKNGDKMIKAFELIATEKRNFLSEAEATQGKNPFILYKLKTKYNLRSPISTELSEKHPKKFIGVYQHIGSKIKMSARFQKGKNVIDILQKAGKGLSAVSGGHPAAAGATVNDKDWKKFQEQLAEALK
ncbi:hypothetical protein CL614_01695 [archaeon]|nr:hypothetical protein [archaeon]|tara:strand:+ start:196 stop:1239 length:1044 start_codon:yes stop_codon:yes gene_type:complete